MHLTRQSDYAIRLVSYLCKLPYGEVVRTTEIQLGEDIPRKYLPSIIRTLARSEIVRTLRGSSGGLSLARPPEEITLREVIEAIEGPISLMHCMKGPSECTLADNCDFLTALGDVQQVMVDHLERTTFADMSHARKVTEKIAAEKMTSKAAVQIGTLDVPFSTSTASTKKLPMVERSNIEHLKDMPKSTKSSGLSPPIESEVSADDKRALSLLNLSLQSLATELEALADGVAEARSITQRPE